MNYTHILAIDPSGNFEEGKGTTGWCLLEKTNNGWIIKDIGSTSAANFKTQAEYHEAHIATLGMILMTVDPKKLVVVIEDYLLYKTKVNNQIHSRLETPQLIGVLKFMLHKANVACVIQPASEVKHRWSNKILVYKGILKKGNKGYQCNTKTGYKPVNKHCIDAIRHAIHYATFKIKKGK